MGNYEGEEERKKKKGLSGIGSVDKMVEELIFGDVLFLASLSKRHEPDGSRSKLCKR